MNSSNYLFSSFLIIVLIFIVNGTECVKLVNPNKFGGIAGFKGFGGAPEKGHDVEPNPKTEECDCKGAQRYKLFCANNGAEYRTMCQFNCDKKSNPRLAKLKLGTCEGLTQNDYFKAG